MIHNISLIGFPECAIRKLIKYTIDCCATLCYCEYPFDMLAYLLLIYHTPANEI